MLRYPQLCLFHPTPFTILLVTLEYVYCSMYIRNLSTMMFNFNFVFPQCSGVRVSLNVRMQGVGGFVSDGWGSKGV